MFDKILIANRGEIACRILRTCRRLGVRTVAVYSDADAGAQHARLADEAHRLGGPRPVDSYLLAGAIIAAAQRSGAEAIHPGYGFLSENADFAEAVEAAGLAFIGPRAASMRKLGSKAGAKELMAAHGVPVVPGYTGQDQDPARLQGEADRIGYPLMIKAAHGGGGKGMRIVRGPEEFAAALESCRREAANAFGRDRVLLERYIERPRHIEFQIFGDSRGHIVHLGERECSAQRRYQKVIEESPSPFLTPELRERMGAAAVAAARAIDYANAGTVEFIVGPEGDFYFMEINTRLQVEHPVTEMTTGLDLVEWQLRIAAGEPLPLAQEAIVHRGHAIEVRLYAEDPEQNFLPGSGRLQRLNLPPTGPHLRIDSGVVEGDTVSIFYDPMIAKLIAHDANRPRALARLAEALAECEIAGPHSNIAFLERLIREPLVVEGRIDTGYLDRALDGLVGALPPQALEIAAAAAAALLSDEAATHARAVASTDPHSPWALADGWRLGHASERLLVLQHGGERFELHVCGSAGHYRLRGAKFEIEIAGARWREGWLSARYDGVARRLRVDVDEGPSAEDRPFMAGDSSSGRVTLRHAGRRLEFERVAPFHFAGPADASGEDRVRAPMPGRIVAIRIEAGAAVAEGQELLVMEAMKMELSLRAPRAGTVSELRAAQGEFVEGDAVLVVLGSPG